MRIGKENQIFLLVRNSGISNRPDPQDDFGNDGDGGNGGNSGNGGSGDEKQDPP